MCTYPPGNKENTDFEKKHQPELQNTTIEIRAKEFFFSDQHLGDNNFCLKPESHEDPKMWQKYELSGFRQAYTKKMLENTKTFKYDKYFSNFEDPEVFKFYTKNEKTAIKKWKKVYKNHFMSRVPGILSSSSNAPRVNYTACIKKCIKMEKSHFAKKCEKDGGYFKCCVTGIGIMEYEGNRNKLIENGFIKDKITHICQPGSMRDPCSYCRTNGICTNKNSLDGEISHSYYPKKKKYTEGKERVKKLREFHTHGQCRLYYHYYVEFHIQFGHLITFSV